MRLVTLSAYFGPVYLALNAFARAATDQSSGTESVPSLVTVPLKLFINGRLFPRDASNMPEQQ